MEIKGTSMAEHLQMLKGLEPIKPISQPNSSERIGKTGQSGSFMEFLSKSVEETNQQNLEAEQRMQSAIAGDDESPHQTMIALQKADISFRLLLSVKEKLLSAYQQVIRTPIG